MAASPDAPTSTKLRIAELFSSIQGEGQWLGVPSTFIRVSGCNLRCHWCDTPYASWEPEGPVLGLDEILGRVAALSNRHVVVTGGEPLLFEAVVALAQALRSAGRVITIETAGTVFRELECDLMSISPKLANSTPSEESGWRERHQETRTAREPLKQLIERYPFQLKFVVEPAQLEADVGEIDALLSDLGEIPADRVFLMAEGREAGALHAKERMLVDACIDRGWRLTPRYQIDLFGDTRGT